MGRSSTRTGQKQAGPGRPPHRAGIVTWLALLPLAGCAGADAPGAAVAGVATFSRDVAPIVFRHCASCHRPGGIAPFSLLTYDDAKPWAARIAAVTAARTMPPWLPAPGGLEFLNDPSLAAAELELIRRWVEAGAAEGDEDDLPDAPEFAEGWQLGEPDLVVELAEPYVLPADTADRYRNFVIPVPVSSTRYVRAVEFRPESEPAAQDAAAPAGHAAMPVHHAVVLVDRTPSSRRMAAADPGPGYEGMSGVSRAHAPDGFFMGWTPGKRAAPFPEGMAWRLDPGTDLVLQMHLRPGGRPERVSARIGLHFTDRPPAHRPSVLLLNTLVIDIPAGASAYTVEASHELPVDVEVLALYPHAHYLARTMRVHATLPDGSRRELLRIDGWDFDWQDAYRYREPIRLPRGSVLHMRYTYDNSASNPDNPSSPPRRVRFGLESTDEMAELAVQVLTRDSTDRRILEREFAEKLRRTMLEGARFATRLDPDDPDAHYRLALLLHLGGARAEAIRHYRRALALRDDDAAAHSQLGKALVEAGKLDEAIRHLRRATELEPGYAAAHYGLAGALESSGEPLAAEAHYRRAIARSPHDARAHFALGNLLEDLGRRAEAEAHLRRAIELDPAFAPARYNLANLLGSRGRPGEAIIHYRAAVAARPDFMPAHINLALALESLGRVDDALDHYRAVLPADTAYPFVHLYLGSALESLGRVREAAAQYRRAVELRPDDAAAHHTLGRALYALARVPEAIEHLRTAARLDPRAPEPLLMLARIFATHPDTRFRDAAQAVRLARQGAALLERPHPLALATLASAHAAAGEFDVAIARAREAVDLASATGDERLARSIVRQLELYRQARPYVAQPAGARVPPPQS